MENQEHHETEEVERNLSQEVDDLLEQGFGPKDIEDRGYSASLIRQRVRKRSKAGQSVQRPAVRDYNLALRKEKESVLPEWLERDVAEIFDGHVRDQKVFIAGMSIPLLGLRLFAEGIKPITALLTAWQKGQADAAREIQSSGIEIAQAAGQVAANGVGKFFMETKPWEQQQQKKPDPMQNMMAETIKPYFQQVMGGVMGGLMGVMPQMQPGPQGNQGPVPGQTNMASGQPAQHGNIEQATEDEIEEAFNDD